jgi:hypothetical protein
MIIDDFTVEKQSDKVILVLSHPVVGDMEQIKIELSFNDLPVYAFLKGLVCDNLLVSIKNLYHLDLIGTTIKGSLNIIGSLNSLDVSKTPIRKIFIDEKVKKVVALECPNFEEIIADDVEILKTDGTVEEDQYEAMNMATLMSGLKGAMQ